MKKNYKLYFNLINFDKTLLVSCLNEKICANLQIDMIPENINITFSQI